VHPYDVLGKTFDVLINMPHELWIEGEFVPCYDLDIRAPRIYHTTFSKPGLVSACKNGTCYDKHHILMPYPLSGFDFNFSRELTREEQVFADKYVHWLPLPYYQEFNDRPLNERREMTWVCKSLFSDEWPEDKDFHQEGKTCLEAAKNFANANDIMINFAQSHMFESDRAKRFGVDKIFESIHCRQFKSELFFFSELNEYFSRSAVNLALPNFAASSFNAIANGCVSIFYEDDFMFRESLSTDLKFHKGISVKEVEDLLEDIYFHRLLTDKRSLYRQLLEEQREKIIDYSYTASYKKFRELIDG